MTGDPEGVKQKTTVQRVYDRAPTHTYAANSETHYRSQTKKLGSAEGKPARPVRRAQTPPAPSEGVRVSSTGRAPGLASRQSEMRGHPARREPGLWNCRER
jgi:hypothetical protein